MENYKEDQLNDSYLLGYTRTYQTEDQIRDNFLKEYFDCKFYQHQKDAFKKAIKFDNFALFMEQGTGKTLVTIAVLYHKYLLAQVKRVLIVVPYSVLEVWEDEFKKFCLFDYELNLFDKKNKEKCFNFSKEKADLQVIVINYESSWRIIDKIKKWGPDAIVLDESQKIKNHTAKQSRGMHRLNKVKTKIILTGTPITQNPLDIFSQFKFLEPDIFGTRFIDFRDRYAEMGGYLNYEVVGYRNLDELSSKVNDISYRITQDEALDLPPVVEQELRFDLSSKAADYYNQMKKDLVVELSQSRKITAPIVLTKLLRLQQITGGFLPLEEKKYLKVNKAKLKQLEDLLTDLPLKKKVVIFCRFLVEIKAVKELCKKLNRKPLILSGKTQNRGKLIKLYQSSKNYNTMIAQIQSGGLGINLNKSEVVIFYSTTFSYADYVQAKARAHRMGQTKPIVNIHLITKKTIDENIMKILKTKGSISKLVIDVLPTLTGKKELIKKWTEKLTKGKV